MRAAVLFLGYIKRYFIGELPKKSSKRNQKSRPFRKEKKPKTTQLPVPRVTRGDHNQVEKEKYEEKEEAKINITTEYDAQKICSRCPRISSLLLPKGGLLVWGKVMATDKKLAGLVSPHKRNKKDYCVNST